MSKARNCKISKATERLWEKTSRKAENMMTWTPQRNPCKKLSFRRRSPSTTRLSRSSRKKTRLSRSLQTRRSQLTSSKLTIQTQVSMVTTTLSKSYYRGKNLISFLTALNIRITRSRLRPGALRSEMKWTSYRQSSLSN